MTPIDGSLYDSKLTFILCILIAVATRFIPIAYRPHALALTSLLLIRVFFALSSLLCVMSVWLLLLGLEWLKMRKWNTGRLVYAVFLVPLFYWKFITEYHDRFPSMPLSSLALMPVLGLSYISFRSIDWNLTSVPGKEGIRPIEMLAFVSFWPSFYSGPIDRRAQFVKSLRKGDGGPWLDGARYIFIGLAWHGALQIFSRCSDLWLSPVAVRDGHILPYFLFGSIEFLKLYLSFASYSLIAAGFAVLVGITPTMNFRAPLIASSLADFWMRWHISLTTWIRDRIFYPILLALARWNNGEAKLVHYIVAIFASFISWAPGTA